MTSSSGFCVPKVIFTVDQRCECGHLYSQHVPGGCAVIVQKNVAEGQIIFCTCEKYYGELQEQTKKWN